VLPDTIRIIFKIESRDSKEFCKRRNHDFHKNENNKTSVDYNNYYCIFLWTSEDGIHFNTYEKGFHRVNQYEKIDMKQVAIHYGLQNREYAKFERPQLLIKNGKPDYMYVPSGVNIYGGDCTVSYVLKFISD